jgi:mannosyl-3-phosphoglycerate phosphatase
MSALPWNCGLVVFTDLDGTLLDAHTFDWRPAAPVLDRLHELGVPIIPVTSRTRAEVDVLRREARLRGPAIVENGSAIVDLDTLPQGSRGRNATTSGDIIIGCSYEQARLALGLLQQRLGVSLRTLSMMTPGEVEAVTGLDAGQARLAAAREFGEVIVPPHGLSFERVQAAAIALGFQLIRGDRFWHLVGRDTDKGRAVRILLSRLTLQAPDLHTVALGNGPSDAGVLAAADTAIVVPGDDGVHPALAQMGWRVAPSPGPAGWAAAVAVVLDEQAVTGVRGSN